MLRSQSISIQSPLGPVDFFLALPGAERDECKATCKLIETIPRMTLPSDMSVDVCRAVIAELQATTSTGPVEFHARVGRTQGCGDGAGDGGEGLEAQEWEGNGIRLHIGTEDGAYLNARAYRENGLPGRLYQAIASYNVDGDAGGMCLRVPGLESGESMHLHFVIAWKAVTHDDVSTWFAVDRSLGETSGGAATGRLAVGWV